MYALTADMRRAYIISVPNADIPMRVPIVCLVYAVQAVHRAVRRDVVIVTAIAILPDHVNTTLLTPELKCVPSAIFPGVLFANVIFANSLMWITR